MLPGFSRALARAAAICLLSLPALAQSGVDGAISGFAEDATGAALPGTIIEAHNPATGLTLTATAGPHGEFLLTRLPAGTYQLSLSYRYLERITLDQVIVQLGTTTVIEPHLPLAGVISSITVNARPEAVEDLPASIAIDLLITTNDLDRLPLDGRHWQSFALLTPTANPDPAGDNLLSFRGLPATQNSTAVDGASDDQSFGAVPRGTGAESTAEAEDAAESGNHLRGSSSALDQNVSRHAGAAYTFSQEAVREFRISGQNYSALYGQSAGGIVTTVSKSGTNALHGSLFYQARTDALAAADPFSIATTYVDGVATNIPVKPHDLRQQFGGSAGGPILHNRLFYFYAFDQQHRNFPAISSPEDPNFFSLTDTQTALLANRGLTPSQISSALNYLSSLTGTVQRSSDQTINFAKLDWQGNDHHRGSLQYNRASASEPNGIRSTPTVAVGRASIGSSYVHLDSILARWLWTTNVHLSNEVRIQFGHDQQFETAADPLPQEPAIGPNGYAPEVAIGPDGFTFGTPVSLGRNGYPDEDKTQLADLGTWIHGRHQLQFGGEVAFVHDTIAGLTNSEGAFHYDSGVTDGHIGGLADWITDYTFNVHAYPNGGCPSIYATIHYACFRSYTQSFGQSSVSFPTQEWAFFVQDEWRVSPSLSLRAGLRYEYELLPIPQQPNPALDAAFGSRGASSVFPEDRNNLGPRVGIAWQPFGEGRGLIRIGYGLFYGRLPGAAIRSALVNTALPSSTTSIEILPTTITECPQVANQGFGYICSYTSTPPAAIAATSSAIVFDRSFRLPAVQQASLSLEREFHSVAISATYLMNLDRQLPNSVDINIAPSTAMKLFQLQQGTGAVGVQDGEIFAVPVYTQRLNPSFGPVTDIISNANATYNALVLEATRRTRRGFEFRANFAWSKALDFGQTTGAAPRTNSQFDPFEIRYDHGLSSLNHPHKIVLTAIYEPTLHHGEHWVRALTNGWATAPIFTEISGRPYSLQIFGGTRLTGGHESINGSGGATYLPTIGRNTARLPDTARLDFRIAKTIWHGEDLKIRAVADTFNLTNHLNISGVTQRAYLAGTETDGITPLTFQNAANIATEGLNTQPFGTFTAASSERRIQLGIRLDF